MTGKKTVLVCGGAGYIGSHVVRCLLNSGLHPVVLDNLATGHRESVPDDVDFIQASVRDVDVLNSLFTRYSIQAVVHLCAWSLVGESVQFPLRYYDNNISGGVCLLDAMVRHKVPNFVFSSTAAVYGQPDRPIIDEQCPVAPINPYGFSKAAFERILSDCHRAYDLRWVALRYFNAAGADASGTIGEDHRNETHLIPLVLQRALSAQCNRPAQPLRVFGNDYPTSDGTCVRDYIHVTDLADAHLLAIQYLLDGREPVAVNLGNGDGFSVLDVIGVCEKVTAMAIPREIAERRAGDPASLVASSAKARKLLGWNPTHSSLENIVRTAWNWHRTHPNGY